MPLTFGTFKCHWLWTLLSAIDCAQIFQFGRTFYLVWLHCTGCVSDDLNQINCWQLDLNCMCAPETLTNLTSIYLASCKVNMSLTLHAYSYHRTHASACVQWIHIKGCQGHRIQWSHQPCANSFMHLSSCNAQWLDAMFDAMFSDWMHHNFTGSRGINIATYPSPSIASKIWPRRIRPYNTNTDVATPAKKMANIAIQMPIPIPVPIITIPILI